MFELVLKKLSEAMTGSVFVGGLGLVSMDSSYSIENLNWSISGFQEHTVIECCFLVICS